MQHIHMKKRAILVELNEALGEPLVRELRLRVGSVED
jgi:hypothetical protein